jgi:hypothetical protein
MKNKLTILFLLIGLAGIAQPKDLKYTYRQIWTYSGEFPKTRFYAIIGFDVTSQHEAMITTQNGTSEFFKPTDLPKIETDEKITRSYLNQFGKIIQLTYWKTNGDTWLITEGGDIIKYGNTK